MLLNWATLCSVKNRHVNSSLLNSRSSLFVCRQEGVPGPYDSRLPLPLASQFGSKHPTVEGLWGEEWTWSTCKLKKFGHWFLSGPADDTTTASEKWFKLVCGQKFGCDHFIYSLSLWWNAANLPCRVEIQANLESFPKKKSPPHVCCCYAWKWWKFFTCCDLSIAPTGAPALLSPCSWFGGTEKIFVQADWVL